jgi:hypothetical protein
MSALSIDSAPVLVETIRITPKRITLGCLTLVSYVGLVAWASGPVVLRAPQVVTTLTACAVGLGAAQAIRWVGAHVPDLTPAFRSHCRRMGDAGVAMTATMALLLAGAAASCLLTPWTGPLVDPTLAALDELAGVTQADVLGWAQRQGAMPLLRWTYFSLELQLVLVSVWHGAIRPDARPLWRAAAVFGLVSLVVLPAYVLWPALGPDDWYGTGIDQPFVAPIEAMRSGPYVLEQIYGVVSVPSCHIVFAVLLLRLWWSTPLRVPSLLVNAALMPIATLVIGGHYLVDAVAGLVLVLVSMSAVSWSTRRSS